MVSLAAYRSGERLTDSRQGQCYDHRERADVTHKEILLPEAVQQQATWAQDRETLWNRAQTTDPGKRARYGHEWLLALPHELSAPARQALARDFAGHLVRTYGCAVDLTIHEPREGGDERNHHAHLLATARKVEAEGFGERTHYNLSWPQLQAKGASSTPKQWQALRQHWIDATNQALNAAGLSVRIRQSQVDEFGLRIPVKPGWSRPVEELIRAGRHSEVANAELNRYDFELRRRELEIRALESDARLDRLRATLAVQPTASREATVSPSPAPTPPQAAEAPFPTDFASWIVWRSQQHFDPLADERRAQEVIRRLREKPTERPDSADPAGTSASMADAPSPSSGLIERTPSEPNHAPGWERD